MQNHTIRGGNVLKGPIDRFQLGIYPLLRRMAAGRLRRERHSPTLEPNDLAHEVFLRMGEDPDKLGARESRQFVAYAHKVMGNVLVDRARKKAAAKNGGGLTRVTFTTMAGDSFSPSTNVRAVRQALEELGREQNGPRRVRLVELVFWGQHTLLEAAEMMGLSRSTATRDWKYARAFLEDQLSTFPDWQDDPRP